jgi:membrane-associated protease RseP (regulator of RpoE activity)
MNSMGWIGVVAFVAALIASVMLHEAGHFFMAKRFGMKVTEFFVGFGPKLYSRVRGETEYGVKAIPAGGYVRILGMTPSEQLSPEDEPRAFYRASVGRRIAVLAAGSITHIMVGFLLVYLLLAGVGMSVQTTTLGAVSKCVSTSANATCTVSATPSPALAAGLQAKDRIVALNGVQVKSWADAVKTIRESANKPLQITVERNHKLITLKAIPASVDGHGVLGVSSEIASKRENPFMAIKDSGITTWNMGTQSVGALIAMPSKIPALWGQTFGNKPRDLNGLVGVVGVARVSGQAMGARDLSWSERIGTFMLILAGLNVFIGIFNALPFPPLDGGHIVVALVDKWRTVRARRRGLAAPAPFDVAALMPVTLVVLGVLISLSLLLLAADIVNPVRLNL